MNNKQYIDLVNSGEYPSDPKVPLDDIYSDSKGLINNLLFTQINSTACILSLAGTTRSNHLHKTDWHYLFVVSGSLKYYERNLDGTDKKEIVFGAGEMFFTAPNKVHKVEFLQDTILMSFAKNVRNHENHEADLIRVEY